MSLVQPPVYGAPSSATAASCAYQSREGDDVACEVLGPEALEACATAHGCRVDGGQATTCARLRLRGHLPKLLAEVDELGPVEGAILGTDGGSPEISRCARGRTRHKGVEPARHPATGHPCPHPRDAGGVAHTHPEGGTFSSHPCTACTTCRSEEFRHSYPLTSSSPGRRCWQSGRWTTSRRGCWSWTGAQRSPSPWIRGYPSWHPSASSVGAGSLEGPSCGGGRPAPGPRRTWPSGRHPGSGPGVQGLHPAGPRCPYPGERAHVDPGFGSPVHP